MSEHLKDEIISLVFVSFLHIPYKFLLFLEVLSNLMFSIVTVLFVLPGVVILG